LVQLSEASIDSVKARPRNKGYVYIVPLSLYHISQKKSNERSDKAAPSVGGAGACAEGTPRDGAEQGAVRAKRRRNCAKLGFGVNRPAFRAIAPNLLTIWRQILTASARPRSCCIYSLNMVAAAAPFRACSCCSVLHDNSCCSRVLRLA